MNGTPINKKELAYHDELRQLGCVVCMLTQGIYTPPEIHHVLDTGRRQDHWKVLPLCMKHHRLPGPGWESRHSTNGKSGKAAFEAAYGTEEMLLDATKKMLEVKRALRS
jgi:hypothetical protein